MRPEPLDQKSPFHPLNIETYKDIQKINIPDAESLKDTYQRVTTFFKSQIENKINHGNILVSAHGNSIRALCKYLFELDEDKITKLEIPTGNPLLVSLNKNLKIQNCKYLDKDRAKDLLVY